MFAVPSIGTVMLIVFWDCKWIIFMGYLAKGVKINAECYLNLLSGLLRQTPKNDLEIIRYCNRIIQDPTLPENTKDVLNDLGWETFLHPPYSLDLAPTDFHLFPKWKKTLQVDRFESLTRRKTCRKYWIEETSKKYFKDGLKKLVYSWDEMYSVK